MTIEVWIVFVVGIPVTAFMAWVLVAFSREQRHARRELRSAVRISAVHLPSTIEATKFFVSIRDEGEQCTTWC